MPAMGSRPDKAVALARNPANQVAAFKRRIYCCLPMAWKPKTVRIAAELRPGLQRPKSQARQQRRRPDSFT